MPFADFGAMIDPPTEDVTAHVLEMLGALGCDATIRYVARGLRYLRETQRPRAAWFGRWGVNYVYGTWCVISALVALSAGSDMVERGAAWLLAVQNSDGGWGESCHSYVDESFAGSRASTASQTAWAVNALQLAGLAATLRHPARSSFLCERQRPGRYVGRTRVHRHRLPARLLHQLPPLSPSLSDDGARRWTPSSAAQRELRCNRPPRAPKRGHSQPA